MTAAIIDGKAMAKSLTDAMALEVRQFVKEAGAPPCLVVLLVGEDPASAVYVRNKGRVAECIGFRSQISRLAGDIQQQELVALIESLNRDDAVHGILVQLPLPAHIDANLIISLIHPDKDVDGFHPTNVGRLGAGDLTNALVPSTPAGVLLLAKSAYNGELSGLHAVIAGRSNIVGKPVAQLLLAENCTVTIAHSRTRNLPAVLREADLLVAAIGQPEFIRGDWIKPCAVVIDVGINRAPAKGAAPDAGKLVGDVAFDEACAVARAITPVPGGVGPMTIAMLMSNTLKAARRQLDGRLHANHARVEDRVGGFLRAGAAA